MKNEELLQLFIPLVEFLGQVLGKHSEILLHDVSTPDNSVIAICNGFHTGRTVGSSMTDLALQIQNEKRYQDEHFITNYSATADGKVFHSSTYYIKNNGVLIGMLCINTDTSASQELITSVTKFIASYNLSPAEQVETTIEETLDLPIDFFADSIIEKTITETGILPARMTRSEKQDVVQKLYEQGIPRMKGAVSIIAKQLNLSESTVYRYLAQCS